MLTPHFGILDPHGRVPAPANGNAPRPIRSFAPGNADDDLGRYSRIERDALLLAAGGAAEFEPTARDAAEKPRARPWRFIGMLFPPYS